TDCKRPAKPLETLREEIIFWSIFLCGRGKLIDVNSLYPHSSILLEKGKRHDKRLYSQKAGYTSRAFRFCRRDPGKAGLESNPNIGRSQREANHPGFRKLQGVHPYFSGCMDSVSPKALRCGVGDSG